jgi:putative membrane protein
MTRRPFLFLASAVVLFAQVAIAQEVPGEKQPLPSAPIDDILFAAAIADGGEAEATLAQLGLEKATNPELRKLSKQMIADHILASKTIRDLYAPRNLQLPTAIDSRSKFRIHCLSGLSGAEFDRAYAKAQLALHLDTVASFEAEAQRGQDPETRAYAARFLPIFREHLKTIRSIVAKGEGNAPADESKP